MSSKCGFEFSIHNIMSRSFSSSFQISTTSHYSECRLYISLSILVAKLVWKQDLGIRRVPLLSNNMDTLGVFLIKIHTYVHITWSSPLSSKLNIKHQSHCASLLREYSTIQTCFFVIIIMSSLNSGQAAEKLIGEGVDDWSSDSTHKTLQLIALVSNERHYHMLPSPLL